MPTNHFDQNATRNHVTFLLDETGSMITCWDDTIKGFNSYIDSLKEGKGDNLTFTLIKFDTEKFEVVYDKTPIDHVKHLTKETYRPGSGTPLLDAIAKAIRETSKVKELTDANILVTVLTDGEENDSKEMTLETLKKLIEEKKKSNWTFAFLGAEIDAYQDAHKFGVTAGNTLRYEKRNTQAAYMATATGTMRWREQNIAGAWDLEAAAAGIYTPETKAMAGDTEETKKK